MKPIAEEFAKWQAWARRIKEDVQSSLIFPRQIYRGFCDVVNLNGTHVADNEGELFCKFVQRCYGVNAAAAIRRHSKCGKDSVSLMRLLVQIRDGADQFTFDFYLERFPPGEFHVAWQEGVFELFSQDGTVVTKGVIQADIDKLELLTTPVEGLVDRTIAHLDQRGFDRAVMYGELDACIDALDEMVCRYLKLTTGCGPSGLEATILPNWTKIFTVPLDNRAAR